MSIVRFPLHQQWGHVGSELGRAQHRLEINDRDSYLSSLERALNMIDEMIADHIGKRNMKEILRFREFLAGNYVGDSSVEVNLKELEHYCNQFCFSTLTTPISKNTNSEFCPEI